MSRLVCRFLQRLCHVLALSHVNVLCAAREAEHLCAIAFKHVDNVLAYAVRAAKHHSHLVAEGLCRQLVVVGLRVFQLEQLVHHVSVFAVGELHVALLAAHHKHRF